MEALNMKVIDKVCLYASAGSDKDVQDPLINSDKAIDEERADVESAEDPLVSPEQIDQQSNQ